jgi:glycosyltransferase involved in cell wall biosynthesis
VRIRFLLHDVYRRGGGVLTVTLGLARDLAAHHDVELVSLFGTDGELPVHDLPPGVTLTRLTDRRTESLEAGSAIRRRLARIPSRAVPSSEPRYDHYSLLSDLVLTRYLRSLRGGAVVTMQPGLSIALARLGTNRYLRVAQEHRPVDHRKKDTVQAYEKHAGAFDAFLTLNDDDAAYYRRTMGERTTVRRIANGTPRYDGPPSSLDGRVVVAAGRLVRSKGFHLLVRAWRQVADRHPDWELRIFGEGAKRGELAALIRKLELQDSVSLMGYSTRLPEEMAKASCFVLSSTAEGYPMVLLEAMGCGLPLVSTDCPSGGPRDIISDGVDGFLVRNRDVDGLADALVRMIELDDPARRRMSQAALAKAEERSPEAIASHWDALLRELAAQRGLVGSEAGR